MDKKPTLMNKEWDDHLQRISWILDRLNRVEARLDVLENKDGEEEEE